MTSDDSQPHEQSAQPQDRPDLGGDAPTEWIEGGYPPPPTDAGADDAGSGGGHGRWVAPVAAIAAVALIGGGAFAAYTWISGGGPQPAEAIPSSAIAYARVDLDPSAEQKINMVRLLRKVPRFEGQTGITADSDDLRERLFDKALTTEPGCADLSYDDDIKPWIGDRAGIAAVPGESGADPDALLVLQVTDESAARDGIDALETCAEADPSGDGTGTDAGIAFVGDYVLLAETQDLADGFAADAEQESLADSDTFSSDLDALGGEGLASFWFDLDGLAGVAEQTDPGTADALAALGSDHLGTVAGAVRARSDAIEVVLAAHGDLMGVGGASTVPVTDIQRLPDSTMAALGFTGGNHAVDAIWQRFGDITDTQLAAQLGPDGIDGLARQIEAQYGIALPDDVKVLLGDQFTLAVDGEGFDVDPATGAPDLSTINIGARMQTDAVAARDLVDRIQNLIAVQTGASFDIADADSDNGIVLASNDEYAQALADDGALGDSDAFGAAVAGPDSATSVLFVDLGKLSDLVQRVGDQTGDPLPADEAATLAALQAFGVSTSVDGDYALLTARLVFN